MFFKKDPHYTLVKMYNYIYILQEIMRQQNTLHKMHMSERLLSSRHEQIKDEIRKLMAASAEVSRQLEELKGQYSTQINDLKVCVCVCVCVCMCV